jgi:hypothetical protein
MTVTVLNISRFYFTPTAGEIVLLIFPFLLLALFYVFDFCFVSNFECVEEVTSVDRRPIELSWLLWGEGNAHQELIYLAGKGQLELALDPSAPTKWRVSNVLSVSDDPIDKALTTALLEHTVEDTPLEGDDLMQALWKSESQVKETADERLRAAGLITS